MRASWLVCLLWCALTLIAGCNRELSASNPQDAYYLFRDGLIDGDAEIVWQRSDSSTHQFFQHQFEQLQEMASLIDHYLPPSDHGLARRQSGAALVGQLSDGKDLFFRLFQRTDQFAQEKYLLGSKVREIRVSEDGDSAVVATRGQQEFILVRDSETRQWYVAFVDSGPAVRNAVKWIDANRMALAQTVEDLIAEEQRQREAIIAELMRFD